MTGTGVGGFGWKNLGCGVAGKEKDWVLLLDQGDVFLNMSLSRRPCEYRERFIIFLDARTVSVRLCCLFFFHFSLILCMCFRISISNTIWDSLAFISISLWGLWRTGSMLELRKKGKRVQK